MIVSCFWHDDNSRLPAHVMRHSRGVCRNDPFFDLRAHWNPFNPLQWPMRNSRRRLEPKGLQEITVHSILTASCKLLRNPVLNQTTLSNNLDSKILGVNTQRNSFHCTLEPNTEMFSKVSRLTQFILVNSISTLLHKGGIKEDRDPTVFWVCTCCALERRQLLFCGVCVPGVLNSSTCWALHPSNKCGGWM